MNNLITIPNVVFIIGLFGTAFTIWNKVRDPQIKADKTDTVLSLEIKNLKEEITNLKDNHIHSLSLAVENTNNNLNTLTIQVTKLATIIEERVPNALISYQNRKNML